MADLQDDAIAEQNYGPADSSDMRHLHHALGHAELPERDAACEDHALVYHVQVLPMAMDKKDEELKVLVIQHKDGIWRFPEHALRGEETVKALAARICRQDCGQKPLKIVAALPNPGRVANYTRMSFIIECYPVDPGQGTALTLEWKDCRWVTEAELPGSLNQYLASLGRKAFSMYWSIVKTEDTEDIKPEYGLFDTDDECVMYTNKRRFKAESE